MEDRQKFLVKMALSAQVMQKQVGSSLEMYERKRNKKLS